MAIALVTGANRGIGLALCKQLAEHRKQVIAVCRRPSPDLEKVAGVHIESGVDVTSDEAMAGLAERLRGTHVDILIANAGILHADSLETSGLQSVREQFEVNALGPLRTVKALRATLQAGSKIALITSRMGSIADNGSGGYYGYRMSKAALNAAGASLAQDLKPQRIAVVILHPGYVRTDMTSHGGTINADDSARLLLQRIDELTLETSGQFLHANGERLPW
jgi:NAD(P)-dependent dehydrogenase (short-subunit alcohol dehydrogenase family)